MKINPVGINSYQQISGQETRRQPVADIAKDSSKANTKVVVRPQDQTQSSRLAVKVDKGNYADFLTTEEQNALDLLFSRYSDRARFGSGYTRDIENGKANDHLGRSVDVKV